mmetsp:Transcript_40824/g.41690  ORF Transcript_40824/g.41690 Transcript_40824/m.41690 type:complete len:663 (+) Transcript_40824:164-2152(+)
MSEHDDDPKAAPSAKSAYMGEGYNQTYIIMGNQSDGESKSSNGNHNVFFRCGNWCYRGPIQFNGLKVDTSSLPVLVPMLQRQQNSLKYYCTAKSLPPESVYYEPIQLLQRASNFIAEEITSDHVEKELRKWAAAFSWIDDDASACYFELVMDPHECMKNVDLVACKTYSRGLIIISIYCERAVYFLVHQGDGDQPLLDVRFPDVSKHGQGLHISSYNEPDELWKKLTLWHILPPDTSQPTKNVGKPRTINLSSTDYIQTYCILRATPTESSSKSISLDHDVLFRFGTWCYSGRVQLTPILTLADIPYVIPALRLQQSKMDYLCDVSSVSATSPFAPAMEYMMKLAPVIENQIHQSEEALSSLIQRLSRMGLGDSVQKWLEGEPGNSFFEFRVTPDEELEKIFGSMELVASKCYHASGIVTITIMFQYNIYVTVLEAGNENPLLDSRFPDVSGKGRGYQLQAYSDGLPAWSQLRKVSVWQTVVALEQEFRERTARLAQSKRTSDREDGDPEERIDDNGERDAKGVSRRDSKGSDRKAVETDVSRESVSDEKETLEDGPSASTAEAKTKSDAKLTPALSQGKLDSPSSDVVAAAEKLAKQESTRELNPLLAIRAPRPHHLPRLESQSQSLAKKVAEMRKNLGNEEEAPWDVSGRPKGLTFSSKK